MSSATLSAPQCARQATRMRKTRSTAILKQLPGHLQFLRAEPALTEIARRVVARGARLSAARVRRSQVGAIGRARVE
jgi:hypothetical protein